MSELCPHRAFPIGSISCDTLKCFGSHHSKKRSRFESGRGHPRLQDKFQFLTHSLSWTGAGCPFFTLTQSLLHRYLFFDGSARRALSRVAQRSERRADTQLKGVLRLRSATARLHIHKVLQKTFCRFFSPSPLRDGFNR